MFGYVKGKILAKSPTHPVVVVENAGIGYEVTLSSRLFDSLRLEQDCALWLHTHVREDILALYGFASDEEKQTFRLLLSVNGLGPKHALSLLAEHGWERVLHLITQKNATGLSEAHGVGKTLAQRIVLDLAAKVEKMALPSTPALTTPSAPATPQNLSESLRDDLASALGHLGYSPAAIRTVLDRLFAESGAETRGFEQNLKQALSELSGRPVTVGEARHA